MTISQQLELPEGRIAWDSTGVGPLVILVPGMGDIRSTYRHLTPLIVAAGYRVITTDLRGHGDSDSSFRHYGGEQTADDLIALIESQGEKAVIVGNSMAAASAVRVAADRPELVDGIVLVGPFVRNPVAPAVMKVVMRIALLPLWIAPVWKAYLPGLYAGRVADDHASHVTAMMTALRQPGHARAFSLTAQTDHDHAEQALPRVTAPSLVVMGEKDPDFPDPVAEAEWLGSALGSTVVMIPEAAHYPQSQQPELVAAPILRFLSRVAPRG